MKALFLLLLKLLISGCAILIHVYDLGKSIALDCRLMIGGQIIAVYH